MLSNLFSSPLYMLIDTIWNMSDILYRDNIFIVSSICSLYTYIHKRVDTLLVSTYIAGFPWLTFYEIYVYTHRLLKLFI